MTLDPSSHQVPPPKDWQSFERHMRDLFEAHWHYPATMHGRIGQPQHGVDVYGQSNTNHAYHGVQCKLHDGNLHAPVTETELTNEIAKAKHFQPPLSYFILATTAPRDAAIQATVRRLNERKRKPFTVEVLFWDDILTLYAQHPDVFRRHYPFVPPMLDSLHQLPSPPPDFTGRQTELTQLLDHLSPCGCSISGLPSGSGGLIGLGGIGKTALALVAAHQLADRYPDAQFFLDLQGTSPKPLSPTDALTRILQDLRPNQELPDDLPILRNLYLSALHDKHALILADNAANADQIRPLLPPPTCALLVTSRRHFLIEGLPTCHTLRLDCLPAPDAEKLLLTICPRIADHAPPIARACGHLPLALRAAAGFLCVRHDIPPSAYVRDLADERRRLETIGHEGVEISVEASLTLTYRQLPPAPARVLRLLSIFPATFDTAAEQAVCEDPAGTQFGELFCYSLVDFDPREERYRLHDLVRLFATRRLDEYPDERFPAEHRHAEHFRSVLASAESLYAQGGEAIVQGSALFDREQPNIEAGQVWAASHVEADESVARLASRYFDAGKDVLRLRLHPRRQIDRLQSALSAARRLKDPQAEANTLGNLGVAHKNLGEVRRAIKYYKQQLKISRKIGDRDGEGIALGNLGLAHTHLGKACRAIKFHCRQLKIACEIHDRRAEGSAVAGIGIAYTRLGEVRRAIDFGEQALVIRRETHDRRGEGNALGNLGDAYVNLGEVHRAIEYYEQQLKIVREIGDRRGESYALSNLGLAYYHFGEVRRAIEFHDQALVIRRELGDRRLEAYTLFNRSLALDKLGQRAAAIADAEGALAIHQQIEDPTAEKVRQQLTAWRA